MLSPIRVLSQKFRSLSIEHKLPVVIGAVLTITLTVILTVTYGALSRSTEVRARERLQNAAEEIALTAATGMAERTAVAARVAADPVLLQLLTSDRRSAEQIERARARLQTLGRTRFPQIAAELWDANRNRITFSGADQRAHRPAPPAELRQPFTGELFALDSIVLAWGVLPITRDGVLLGYLAYQTKIGGPSDAVETMRRLTGEEVSIYTRNVEGGFWARAPGQLAEAPLRQAKTAIGLSYFRPEVGRTIAVEAPIAGTPWLAVVEAPASSVLARVRSTVLPLAGFSAVLTLIAVLIAAAVGRRIAQPLVSVTRAAEALTAGDYPRRIEVGSTDEIGRLANSFNQMAAEIEASRRELERRMREAQHANRAKSDFLAVMSHELRTPLNAIGGYADLLEMQVHGPINEQQRDALLRIARNQTHLLSLINDILNYTKIDAGRVHYAIENVPLNETLGELEMLIAPQVRAKNIIFAYRPCDPTIQVRADRDKLQQVVLNLLSNAVKFTPAGGHILVEAAATGEHVHISVRDTGVGIPADRLSAIFDPFFQVDRARNRPIEGIGLGLAISRDLARGMGGELTVESTLGEGATFTITLQRARVGSLQTA